MEPSSSLILIESGIPALEIRLLQSTSGSESHSLVGLVLVGNVHIDT